MAEAGSNPGSSRPVAEFRLRSTSATSCSHNIMTLAGPPVNMANFTTPVRLIRDPAVREEANAGSDEEGSQSAILNVARKKKTTRLIPQNDEEELNLKAQERAPWLLEDFDGQHSYISQMITPEAKYVVFVNQGNEFQVLLTNKWYKFTPKLSYRPLTLEEAEERMASKGKNEDYDRWLMRKRTANLSGESSGTASVSATDKPNGPVVAKRYVNLEEEGFDFQEFVDDDDGEGLYSKARADDDDPSMPRIERPRPQKNLTEAGKQVKKLVKNLDKSNYLYHDSDDEGYDPYADEADQRGGGDSSSDLGDESRKTSKPPAAAPIKPMFRPALIVQKPTDSQPSQKPVSKVADRSRSKSPSGSKSGSRARSVSPQPSSSTVRSGASTPPRSPVPSPTSADTSTSTSANAILNELDIINVLRRSSCTTKDLIAAMKDKLKADPQNKDRFREILRRVASIKSGGSQEQDKILELKPEYR